MSAWEPIWVNGGIAPDIVNLVTTKEVCGQLTAPGGFTTVMHRGALRERDGLTFG